MPATPEERTGIATSCHLGKGATSKPDFFLGLSPRDQKTITTLRHTPTVRDTFKSAGIKMERYDTLPNYWDTAPHNIKKRTERTRSCEICHVEKKGFLTKETLIKNGSKANEQLLYNPKPIKRRQIMKKSLRYCLIFVLLGLILPFALLARDIEPIVSTDWLEKNLNNPKLIIVDVRKVEDYKAGHIPNAINVIYGSWAIMKGGLRNEMPPADDLSDVISAAGIGPESLVVVVGKADTIPNRTDISRVAWTLKYAGIGNVAILDGGFDKWAADKKALSTDLVKPKPTRYQAKTNEGLLANKDYVMNAIGKVMILDIREPDFYQGTKKMDFVAKLGRIKGAVNLPGFTGIHNRLYI